MERPIPRIDWNQDWTERLKQEAMERTDRTAPVRPLRRWSLDPPSNSEKQGTRTCLYAVHVAFFRGTLEGPGIVIVPQWVWIVRHVGQRCQLGNQPPCSVTIVHPCFDPRRLCCQQYQYNTWVSALSYMDVVIAATRHFVTVSYGKTCHGQNGWTQ